LEREQLSPQSTSQTKSLKMVNREGGSKPTLYRWNITITGADKGLGRSRGETIRKPCMKISVGEVEKKNNLLRGSSNNPASKKGVGNRTIAHVSKVKLPLFALWSDLSCADRTA